MNRLFFSSIIITLFFAFTACGGGGDNTQESQETASEDAESTETVDDGIRTINIIGTDNMKFVVESEGEGLVTGDASGEYILLEAIEVAPGEEVRINLTTVSNLPPTAMSHNWTLVAMGTDTDAFARASITARDNEYIAPDFEDQVITHTAMLGDGQTDSITFTAPEDTGDYDYLCTFPGHYAGGMVGVLRVQE